MGQAKVVDRSEPAEPKVGRAITEFGHQAIVRAEDAGSELGAGALSSPDGKVEVPEFGDRVVEIAPEHEDADDLNGALRVVESLGAIENLLKQGIRLLTWKGAAHTCGAKLGPFAGDIEQAFALEVVALLDVAVVLEQEQQDVVINGRSRKTCVSPCVSEPVPDVLGQNPWEKFLSSAQ